MTVLQEFVSIMKGNKEGSKRGVYSICSSHEDVIIAGIRLAKEQGQFVLIESTSNQVDQYGGYTGMQPHEFVNYVKDLATRVEFPHTKILFGGDHLGPNAWQSLPSSEAMEKACVLVSKYVKAGYQKIHLDASMYCLDDEGDRSKPLSDTIVAQRAAFLAEAAERAWKESRGESEKPIYVIGTEVPIPGGAKEKECGVKPTSKSDAEKTIQVTQEAFEKIGLSDAFSRVVALVVQPGVEFGDDQVFQYNRDAALPLSRMIESQDSLVYESHSTDYQSRASLTALVEDHFCILKVGPWLTFAYREALFALECMEKELFKGTKTPLSNISKVLDDVMVENPNYWKKYYEGDDKEQAFKRLYSFSDRCRYYWPDSRLKGAVERLLSNIDSVDIPLSLLSQYLPNQYYKVMDEKLKRSAHDIVIDRIQDVMRIYSHACGN
jgi:D-tagatose-1,6-bisphosphate aldolase subunit GatZ/KbaZ